MNVFYCLAPYKDAERRNVAQGNKKTYTDEKGTSIFLRLLFFLLSTNYYCLNYN